MTRRWLAAALALAAVAIAALAALRLGAPASSQVETAAAVARPPGVSALPAGRGPVELLEVYPRGPDRNLWDLARRLRGVAIPPGVRDGPPWPRPITDAVGARRQFTVTDLSRNRRFTVEATLRLKGERAVMWTADNLTVSDADLMRALNEFESLIYPQNMERFAGRDLFASAAGPVIAILNATIPGVAGYYSESDAYPVSVNPHSNEMTMFFMSVPAVRPGSRGYSAVLAHEFQHMIHAFLDPSEETWVNEGLSELAADLAGFGESEFVQSFRGKPDTPLTIWSAEIGGAGPNYGAAYLFMKYLYQRYGGRNPIVNLATNPLPGLRGVDWYLTAAGDPGFLETFEDWVLANRLDRPETGFGYTGLRVGLGLKGDVRRGETVQGSVPPFAAAYYGIPRDAARIEFSGQAEVRIAPVDPVAGRRAWWSNRADAMNSRLRREFDLTGVSRATLRYATWFEAERPWDFGYVTISGDGGTTWTVVGAPRSTTEDPLGLAYGPGYTGDSNGWVDEEIDLTPWAGKRILLQFEYVTDEAVNLTGWMIDRLSIPEIGFFDEMEMTNGWVAEGFILTDNRLPQYYSVQLYGVSGTAVERIRLIVDESGFGRLDLEPLRGRFDRLELAIAGVTPITSQPARFSFSVS